MKIAVAILATAALAAAAPKPTKLQFRNLFKHPKETESAPPLRIIGGKEAEPHSIPFQLFLELTGGGKLWYCGGSLISANYVLTAAHCGVGVTQAHVILGAHDRSKKEPTQVVAISYSIQVHPDYNEATLSSDIALIKLPASVIFTDAIRPVALPSFDDAMKPFTGVMARVSGWGLTDIFADAMSDLLYYVDVEVMANESCGKFFDDLASTIICTSGDDATGSCSGDSGGPLVDDHVQIGVVSFGIIDCLPGFPTAFTRTTSFLHWIADNSDARISDIK